MPGDSEHPVTLGDPWVITNDCRTYWGSHGCHLERGHEGGHICCCECSNHPDEDSGCVGTYPYYGRLTWFYGEDAPRFQVNKLISLTLDRLRRWRYRVFPPKGWRQGTTERLLEMPDDDNPPAGGVS